MILANVGRLFQVSPIWVHHILGNFNIRPQNDGFELSAPVSI
jgi:hypothetical protein